MYMYVYIQTSIPSLPILLEYAKDTQRTIVDIMDERETLAFTVCVYRRCNGGAGEQQKERKNKQKRKLEEEESHWVICVCTFTLKGDDLLLQDMS